MRVWGLDGRILNAGLSRTPRFSDTFPPILQALATTQDITPSLNSMSKMVWRCWTQREGWARPSAQLHLRRINQWYSLVAFLLSDTVLCTYIMCKRQLNITEELNFSLFVCLLSLLSNQKPQNPACKSITFAGRITEEVVGETMIGNASGVWQNKPK